VDPIVDLYRCIRTDFPGISSLADIFHNKRWDDTLDIGTEYAWFEALADALNEEMRREVPYSTHGAMLEYLAVAHADGPLAVQQCIDVSFVENLFWRVPSEACAPYWKKLPLGLKKLYLDFHHHEP
jgi:hypothetical protein